jgi:hypothetical protein
MYLGRKNTHWVLVSHLSGLLGRFDKNEVKNLKTTKNYKLMEAER